jgi:hypothetical protein
LKDSIGVVENEDTKVLVAKGNAIGRKDRAKHVGYLIPSCPHIVTVVSIEIASNALSYILI